MAMKPSSSSSSFSKRFSYDVFLSFRGKDTRYGFTGNLCDALLKKGIRTFMDDVELQRGDEITPKLEKAIEESRISIIVFSPDYASSSFCLNELAHIHKCKEEKGVLVIPIFHNVDPSDVRYQKGKFGERLANHVKKYETASEKLNTWKNALSHVANLSGYTFKAPGGEKYEHKLRKKIVQFVSRKINRTPLHLDDDLVGLESQVLQLKVLLDVGSDDNVHMVGIHGPGGMGKTTLAVAVYNSIADNFEALCFLKNVREDSKRYGLTHLQSNLLSETVGEKKIKITSEEQGSSQIKHRLQNKKVLLIVDDVDDIKQLEAIIGSSDWFGGGSRVIITTRNKQLLASHGVQRTYEVKELNEKDALQLLSSKAFKLRSFDPCYQDVLNEAIAYASGLPLALRVIGSNLCGKPMELWESALNDYKRIPDKKIQDILKVSYDGLGEEEQSVFLDISCCFKGYTLKEVEDILQAHYDGHCMKNRINVLVDRSLISICDSIVTLHDLIEDMGKDIVREESPKEPGERSRLWFHEHIIKVLKDNKGTSKTEILHMNFGDFKEEVEWDGFAFKDMKNLRILIIKGRNDIFSTAPKHLPNSLRVLDWSRYPSVHFPNDFYPKELVICSLPSNFTSNGFAALFEKKFRNLTILNFVNCIYLKETPDVSCLEGLKEFSVGSCCNLLTVHKSVGFLKKLRTLNAGFCVKLKSFPPIKLISLETLELRNCKSLENFPEVLAKMENVKYLSLQSTSIKKFPESFQNLSGLEELYLSHSIAKESYLDAMSFLNISKMPKVVVISDIGLQWPRDSLPVHSNVQYLSLDNCNLSDDFFQIALSCFDSLKELNLRSKNFKFIPECFKQFHSLTSLSLSYCWSLQEIRGIPPKLKIFDAYRCDSLTSSCKSILLNQELHEAGYTDFRLPRAEIPKWFERRSRGVPISFRVRKELPAIAICFRMASAEDYSLLEYEGNNRCDYLYRLDDGLVYSLPKEDMNDKEQSGSLILIFNGHEHKCYTFSVETNVTYLLDLREILPTKVANLFEFSDKRQWINVQIIYKNRGKRILMESGIHMLNEQSREDIHFIDDLNNSYTEYENMEVAEKLNNSDTESENMEVAENLNNSDTESENMEVDESLNNLDTESENMEVDESLNNSDTESENMEVAETKTVCWTCELELPKKCRFTSDQLTDFLREEKFKVLKSLNFDGCQFLEEIPDVSFLQQLEKLSFQWCPNLLTIHESVGSLENLKILKAGCCCKLKSFPRVKLSSLEQLDLVSCDSLESFPETSGKMENLTKLNLDGTRINLTGLQQLEDTSSCLDHAAIFLRNISVDTGSSNIQHLSLRNCNLSNEFFPIARQCLANVKELDLSENNFTVIPESIKECRFLTKLTLERCRYLEEIKGVPPNLKHFSATECPSLTSSSRSMLLEQELHKAGNTNFYFSGANIIPEWFEYWSKEQSICFRFYNKLPAVAICLLREDEDDDEVYIIMIIDGMSYKSDRKSMGKGTTLLFDLQIFNYFGNWNRWCDAKIIYISRKDKILVKTGIHILEQQSSVEDIQFIDPQIKTKFESQNQPLLKRLRLL